jgi:hypothetical protein
MKNSDERTDEKLETEENRDHRIPTGPAPIRITWQDSDRFESLWLSGGHRFTQVQRLGFLVFSLIAILLGAVCLLGVWTEIEKRSWYSFAWLVPAIPLLYVGIRGLWFALTAKSVHR